MKTDSTTLALFDFDKTLYKKDSLIEFTKFSQGNLRFYLGLIYLSPNLILMKLGILSNKNVKQKYIVYFFKSITYNNLKKMAADFAVQKIERDLNPEVYEKFQMHINAQHQTLIVTASIPEWIEPWSQKFGVKVIGSNWEVVNNKITGKLATENCYGKEKVNRINKVVDLKKFDKIYVYGSGKGDLEMLQLFKE